MVSNLTDITEECMTNTALSALNLDGPDFDLVPSGVVVPLTHISYNNGFDISRGNNTFTADKSGYYLIQYKIDAHIAISIKAAIYKNGMAIPGLTDETSGEKPSGAAIVFLNTGDCLQLMIFGNGKLRLTENTGAALNIIKVA